MTERKEEEIGVVISYYAKISVAAVEITGDELKKGDRIHIRGATTDFEQTVESMQIEKEPMEVVRKGDKVGIKVKERVRPKDKVFKVLE